VDAGGGPVAKRKTWPKRTRGGLRSRGSLGGWEGGKKSAKGKLDSLAGPPTVKSVPHGRFQRVRGGQRKTDFAAELPGEKTDTHLRVIGIRPVANVGGREEYTVLTAGGYGIRHN